MANLHVYVTPTAIAKYIDLCGGTERDARASIEHVCATGRLTTGERRDGTPTAYVRGADLVGNVLRAVVVPGKQAESDPVVVAVLPGGGKGNVTEQRRRRKQRQQSRQSVVTEPEPADQLPPPGQLLYTADKSKTICHVCGEPYRNLGAHSAWKHALKAAAYRRRYGLAARQSLDPPLLQAVKRDAAIARDQAGIAHRYQVAKHAEIQP